MAIVQQGKYFAFFTHGKAIAKILCWKMALLWERLY